MMMGNYLLTLRKQINQRSYFKFKKIITYQLRKCLCMVFTVKSICTNGSITLANYATAERYFLIGERELSYEFAVKALKQIEKILQNGIELMI